MAERERVHVFRRSLVIKKLALRELYLNARRLTKLRLLRNKCEAVVRRKLARRYFTNWRYRQREEVMENRASLFKILKVWKRLVIINKNRELKAIAMRNATTMKKAYQALKLNFKSRVSGRRLVDHLRMLKVKRVK